MEPATAVPVITFNDKGQITSATTTSVAGVSGFAYDSSNKRFRITTQAGTNLTHQSPLLLHLMNSIQ